MFLQKTINFILLIFIFSFLIFLEKKPPLCGIEENPLPIFCIGGGFLDAGAKHSGGVFQIEYKWAKYIWRHLRPQITLSTPEFHSCFLGVGIGWELNLTDRITLIPSFSPGIYSKGKGKKLGFPIEFRSAIELSYHFNNSWVGIQAYHISNAHLGNKNPGLNAYVLFFGLPLTNFQTY